MQTLLTHPMQNALYFSTGDPELDEEAWMHFALSVPYYTHFTSPIRRYADVVVHRLLDAALARDGRAPYDHNTVRKRLKSVALCCCVVKEDGGYDVLQKWMEDAAEGREQRREQSRHVQGEGGVVELS